MKNKNLLIIGIIVLLVVVLVFVNATTFEDLIQEDFNNGTFFQTEWNSSGNFVWLAPSNTSGTFTSQIFNAGGSTTWNNISWVSSAIGELPANQEVESSFGSGNINMTGNVLLMHFNNDSTYGENDTYVYDFSGNGNNGEVSGASWNSTGKLNGAFEFDGNEDYIRIFNSPAMSGDLAISLWIKGRDFSTDNNYFLSLGYNNDPSILYYYDGELKIVESNGELASLSSGIILEDDEWYHIIWSRNSGTYTLYVNGVNRFSGPSPRNANPASNEWTIGWAIPRNNSAAYFNGTIDEVAVWNRGLSETEISDIYKRGATRLNLTVQNCSSSDCSDGTWQDINDTSVQDLNLISQYFRYKYEFETDNANYSPELYNVSLDYDEVPPVVNISLIFPTTNISVYKNKFFNFTVNVSCSKADCGEVNVSLDPVVNWWNSSWLKRKEINITNTGSTTLINFPVYLNLSYDSNMQADFSDLRFINGSCEDDSSLELAYEIENYTETKADVWIKIPSFAVGINNICMYYNNSEASNRQNATGVWDDNYKLVQHLQETDLDGEVGGIKDSTKYGNNGTSVNMDSTNQVHGKIDGSLNFSDSNEWVNNYDLDLPATLTIEAWINLYEYKSYASIVNKYRNADAYIFDLTADGKHIRANWGDGSFHPIEDDTKELSLGTFYHVVWTKNNTYQRLYVDGSEVKSDATGGTQTNNDQELRIGNDVSGGPYSFPGIIDEVRISNTTRSPDWINQSYQLVAYQDTYVSYGTEEEYLAIGKSLISTIVGTTPFYTNASSNPLNISLSSGESRLVTFWVNATGDLYSSYEFFSFANITSNMSIGAITETLNLTIVSNPILILNSVQSPESPTNYIGTYQFNITVSDYDGDFDTVYFSWNDEANQSVTTYNEISGSEREYYYNVVTPLTRNDIPFAWFVNDSEGNVDTFSGTYSILAAQTSASLTLDKIISLKELNATDIVYNVTLRVVNKGGSDATSVVLVDSDSSESPYNFGTLREGKINSTSYLKTYSRNSTDYNVTLAIATVNGIDSYESNEINDSSSEIVLIVPATTANEQLTLIKNVYYNSENSTAVNYTVSIIVVNSGGVDLSSITVIDNDLDLSTSIDLNRTQNYSSSGYVIVDKAASNTNKLFAKSFATVNGIVYESNQIQIRIPGYGGPADIDVYAPASVQTSTDFDSIIEIENVNPDIGQDFSINYWITNNDESINYTSGQKVSYVGASSKNNETITLNSPSSAGTYRLRALVSWVGGSDTAYDSFSVIAPSERDSEDNSGRSSGGGGITGGIIYESDNEDIKEGIIKQLRDNDKIKFNIVQENYIEEHFLEIINLKSDSALITIYSEPITFNLDIGKNKSIDLNNDGYYDVYVKLNKIKDNKAYIYLKTIYKKIEVKNEIGEEGDEKLGDSEGKEKELASTKLNWIGNVWNKIKSYFEISLNYVLKNKVKIIFGKKKKVKKSRYSKRKVRFLEIKIKHLKSLKRRDKISDINYHKELERLLNKMNKALRNKPSLITLFSFGLIGVLSASKKEVTGFAINNSELIVKSLIGILYFVFVLGILGLLGFIHRHNIKKVKIKVKEKIKNKFVKPKNRINSLINKKVYTEEGSYIGKIKGIVLEKNKINSLKIKLNKKNKFNVKGILLKFKDVKNIGHIVIVNERILHYEI